MADNLLTIHFLSTETVKEWTGTPIRLKQKECLENWGYKMGKDFWLRLDGSLAVKAELLQSKQAVHAPTEPDESFFDETPPNQQTPSTKGRS